MKLTFILFAFIINCLNPHFIKAEQLSDSSNKQVEKTSQTESANNKISEYKKIHIVQVGDTITSISNFYSIKKDLIIKLNNLKDENYIYVGQNLRISNSIQEIQNNELKKNLSYRPKR